MQVAGRQVGTGAATHSFEEHTGEVRFKINAPELGQLFVEAGKALAELQLETPAGDLQPPERIALQAPDRDALLVDWLNELIFLSDTRKRVYLDFHVQSASDQEITAQVRGRPMSRVRTQVKAATFHDLSIARGPNGFTAEVVLDV